MRRDIMIASLVLALGAFAAAETPRVAPETGQSQQQNQRTNVEITQQPRVENTGDTSATIMWSTNVQSGSRIRYGTDRNNLSQTATAPWGGVTHRVELKNLRPNTTYYYQVISEHASGSGTSTDSNIDQFRTGGNGQQAQYGDRDNDRDRNNGQYQNRDNDRDHDRNNAQYQNRDNNRNGDNRNYDRDHDQYGSDNVAIVAGPVVQNLTPNNATLWWQTNSTAANDVVYGTDPNNITQRAYERGGSKDHTAELDNLQPGRTYFYKILRRDGSIRTTGQFSTPGGQFGYNNGRYNQNYPQTPQGQYPGGYNQGANNGRYYNQGITNGPIIETVGPNNATIAWTTNTQASSVVRYGMDPNSLTQTAQGSWSSGGHRVQLNNLRPNTRYFFEVISAQRGGVGGATVSNTGQFQTLNPGQAAMTIRQPTF